MHQKWGAVGVKKLKTVSSKLFISFVIETFRKRAMQICIRSGMQWRSKVLKQVVSPKRFITFTTAFCKLCHWNFSSNIAYSSEAEWYGDIRNRVCARNQHRTLQRVLAAGQARATQTSIRSGMVWKENVSYEHLMHQKWAGETENEEFENGRSTLHWAAADMLSKPNYKLYWYCMKIKYVTEPLKFIL